MNGESRPKAASAIAAAGHSTTFVEAAGTVGAPTWYLRARPLQTCCYEDEYAIHCPRGCGRQALAWRSRPGERAGGWGCASCGRGPLWELLGAAA
jgi:hypothetical protein